MTVIKSAKQLLPILLVGLSLISLGACASSSSTPGSDSADAVVASTETQVKRITPAAFLSVYNPDTIILDVRTPEEFAEAHLENAININVQAGDFQEKVRALNPDQTIYLYCRSGNRSARAGDIMSAMGFTSLNNIGGLADLERAGASVVKK